MARLQHLLLCVSIAVLLVTPCCNAARSLHITGSRGLLTSSSVFEDESNEESRGNSDQGVPTSGLEKGNEYNEWARFQAQEVTMDYTPAGANPDPGNPSPLGD